MLEEKLSEAFVARARRMEVLRQLANLDHRANDLDLAYEALVEKSYTALADMKGYHTALAGFLLLIMLGDADRLVPELRREIERGEVLHRLQIAEAMLMVSAYGVLLLAQSYAGRPEAVRARSTLTAMVDAIAESIGDELGYQVMSEFLEHTGNVSQDLSLIVASQVPLVQVEVGIPLPSTLLGWKLYQKPERAGELLERNGIATPAYMPTSFQALSA